MSRTPATEAQSPESVIDVDNDEETVSADTVPGCEEPATRDHGDSDGELSTTAVPSQMRMASSSSTTIGHPHCGLSARSVSEPVVMTVYPSSSSTDTYHHHQKNPPASGGNAVRRTQSKLRMFLKRYRDALIGSSSSSSRTAAVNGNGRARSRSTVSVCPITHHEAIEQRSSCTSWYVDETTVVDDGEKTTLAVVGVACVQEEDVCVPVAGGDGVAEVDYPCEPKANIVACQPSGSNVAVGDVSGRGGVVEYGCEDQLSQSSADTVLDMEALTVDSDRLIDAEVQQHKRSHSDGTEVSVVRTCHSARNRSI